MTNQRTSGLTSAEIAALWESYQGDTMEICGLKQFLVHVEDEETKNILAGILSWKLENVDRLTTFFKQEGYPLPQGFTEQDVNMDAPRLFSDKLLLTFSLNLTNLSLIMYSGFLVVATRSDIVHFFSENLNRTKELHLKAKSLVEKKGIYDYAPEVPKQKQVDFVKKQSFLAGWFTDRRPLIAMEITALFYNIQQNAIGQAIITGFSQVAESKEVRRYFEKGRDIAGKHYDIFNTILKEEYLSSGVAVKMSEVTDSTIAPFSDKLMIALISSFSSAGITNYGASLAMSPRRDLAVHYTRLVAEIVAYVEDGANMMIDNGWMEQPPMAADRKQLAK